MTVSTASAPRQAAFIVYINGIEVPARSVSLRFGVWQVPEMQIEMVADPVLVRLGSEDRVQVAVFYYDDCDVAVGVKPAFRLFGEGEITGWGYRNTPNNRSIVFTVVNQIAIFSQLFVQFMTTLDDMIGHATGPDDVTGFANPSSQLIYPYALFNQGLLPGKGAASSHIDRPFDFLYNTVKGMMASNVPDASRTIPAANFFTRWARLTNFHNRFAGSPFFDEISDANIFPVLKALQNTSAVEVISKNLLSNIQNSGSIWDMLEMTYQTMLMEIAMIPSMPLVTVSLVSGLVQATNFAEHTLEQLGKTTAGVVGAIAGAATTNASLSELLGKWVPSLSAESRKTNPKRLQNYFPKPQMLFSVPPSCNVMFPSQILTIAYDENYATQPTRMYFNDEVISNVLKIPNTGLNETIMNALAVAYPPEADLISHARGIKNPKFNGKNLLLYPEEFYKGPVMDRRVIPKWLYFLEQSKTKKGSNVGGVPAPADTPVTPLPSPPRTGSTPAPKAQGTPSDTMVTQSDNGKVMPNGQRLYLPGTELLRSKIEAATLGTIVPSEYALVWINIESGGKRLSSDADDAEGIFQLLPEECAKLRSKNFPNGVDPEALANDPENKIAIQSGVDYIVAARRVADALAKAVGITWSEADMWRLTKFRTHGLPAYGRVALFQAKTALGHAPVDWAEFYHAVISDATALQKKALNNATATGVLLGASGTMISASDPVPFTAGGARPAPSTPSDVATSQQTAPAAPSAPTVSAATYDAAVADDEDVNHLYAKFEYFRERYAKRSGSATVAWNPYVVPGFPGVLFDQRASRVDLMVYITTVQQRMSHDGQRNTTLSFLYGRQFQEMFDLMATEFSRNDATARGSAPQEPIRDISKVTQSFTQAETYYQKLFYGAQPLFGKDAAFDFRKIVGYAPLVAGGAPEPIFVDGPDGATQDVNVAAASTVKTLTEERDKASATALDLQSRMDAAQKVISFLAPTDTPAPLDVVSTVQHAELVDAQTTLNELTVQLATVKSQLVSLDLRLRAAYQTLHASADTSNATRVEHNLVGDRDLVPLPASRAMFGNRDAALRYNWRPVCTLDEYIVFHDSAGEGQIPAVGHSRSVGARYFDRIRTFIAPAADFFPPTGSDGLAGASVPGLSNANFPNVRANWDDALLAYKHNVLHVKAPRT